AGQYEKAIDRESAYEILKKRAQQVEERREQHEGTLGGRRDIEYEQHGEFKIPRRRRGSTSSRSRSSSGRSRSRRQSPTEAFSKSLLRSLGSSLGRVLGGLLTGGRRRR
ncbi:MAG: helicase HerA-like domain-containing protein, partial [Pseudomonadota bacterium]